MRHSSSTLLKTIQSLTRWQFEMRQRCTTDKMALKVLEARITNLTQRRRIGDFSPETQAEIDAAIDSVKSEGL